MISGLKLGLFGVAFFIIAIIKTILWDLPKKLFMKIFIRGTS